MAKHDENGSKNGKNRKKWGIHMAQTGNNLLVG